jgi:hypothetical protein
MDLNAESVLVFGESVRIEIIDVPSEWTGGVRFKGLSYIYSHEWLERNPRMHAWHNWHLNSVKFRLHHQDPWS